MPPLSARQRDFWAATKRLTLWLLLAWLLVNLAVPWFARDLHAVQGFGFPLGYWLAAQGALLVYLVLIVIYVVAMNRLEAQYDATPEPAEPPTQEAAPAAGDAQRTGPGAGPQ